MNVEGQEMGKYEIFVVLMGNTKIIEEPEFNTRAPVLNIKQGRIWIIKKH